MLLRACKGVSMRDSVILAEPIHPLPKAIPVPPPHFAFLVQRKPLKEKRMKEDWPASQNVKS